MIKEFETSVVTSLQSITFPFVNVDDEANLPNQMEWTPFLTMSLARSATNLAPVSPDAFSISATIPKGPAALPVFILVIAFTTISTSICMGGPTTGSAVRVLRIPRKTLHSEAAHSVCFQATFLASLSKERLPESIFGTFVTNHILVVFSQLFCNFENVVHPRF